MSETLRIMDSRILFISLGSRHLKRLQESTDEKLAAFDSNSLQSSHNIFRVNGRRRKALERGWTRLNSQGRPVGLDVKLQLKSIFARCGLSQKEWLALAKQATMPSSTVPLVLPDKAPAIWEHRNRRTEKDPIEFLRKYWGVYIDAKVLYQNDISRLGDPKLVQTVRAWCSRQSRLYPEKAHEFVARDILPPPRRDRVLELVADLTPEQMQAAWVVVERERQTAARAKQPMQTTLG